MSREDRPKQLLRFIERPGDTRPRSLLDLAAERLEGLVPIERQYIVTAQRYREAIRAALPQFSDDRILGEPMGRDTVNAVGLSAAVFEKMDPDAIFAVFTADHIIDPLDRFRDLINIGYRLVEDNPALLVTFSIRPTYPATGFGYVERGAPLETPEGSGLAFRVARFVEKPDLPRATAYVQSGVFGWNSGMFVWKARTFLEALRRFRPDSHEGLQRIQEAWGTEHQARVLEEVYPTLPKISVDYAVMEPASKARDRQFQVCTVLMDVRWLDVGSWLSYGETLPAVDGNRTVSLANGERGAVVSLRGTGNLVVNAGPGHVLALLGCRNLIVVHTPDATLIMPQDRADELKDLHALLPPGVR